MDELSRLARARGITLVEDAAEAHGARYKDRLVGSIGDVAAFSLFGNKVITSGEGGLVATADPALDARVRLYRDQGLSKESPTHLHYYHSVVGFNYDMSNLQAAVAVAQLERIDHFLERKRAICATYMRLLEDCPFIEFAREMPWAKSSCWMTSVLVRREAPITRDDLIQALRARGIDSRPFFYPIHRLPPYESGQHLPVTDDIAARGLNLPSSTSLRDEAIERIVGSIKDLLK
jgi:perosamine synthetase